VRPPWREDGELRSQEAVSRQRLRIGLDQGYPGGSRCMACQFDRQVYGIEVKFA
jgi:hypothetical protein